MVVATWSTAAAVSAKKSYHGKKKIAIFAPPKPESLEMVLGVQFGDSWNVGIFLDVCPDLCSSWDGTLARRKAVGKQPMGQLRSDATNATTFTEATISGEVWMLGPASKVYRTRWWQLKHSYFYPGSLGKWSNLTSIFFKWVGSTTN